MMCFSYLPVLVRVWNVRADASNGLKVSSALFIMDSYNSPTTKPLFRASQVVWYVLSLIEAVLIIRFFLKLLGANPAAGFTDFVYSISKPFVTPFLAVFNITIVEGNVFEWTTLLAIVVYWLIATGIVKLLVMSRSVSRIEAAKKLSQEEGA